MAAMHMKCYSHQFSRS